MVVIEEVVITDPQRAIICFGPATDTTGMQAGAFYECVIDPHMQSPGGEFIRFDTRWQGGEVHGWQRLRGFTVCELLGAHNYDAEAKIPYEPKEGETVMVQKVKAWAAS